MSRRRLPADVAPVTAGSGQESVWDYPRPARREPTSRLPVVICGGEAIAQTCQGYRVLETSHPPGYDIPTRDWRDGALSPAAGASLCEWKGRARYFDVRAGDSTAPTAASGDPEPTPRFAAIADCVSGYPGLMGRREIMVIPQPGGVYGGWITPDIVGPCKGNAGPWGW